MNDNSNNINKLWEEWSTRKLPDGRKFDDVFRVDGVPIWWFLYTRVRATDIPPPFRDINQLEQDIAIQRTRTTRERFYFSLFRLALRSALRANEIVKGMFAGFSQKTRNTTGKAGVLFLDYVKIVKKQENMVVLYKAENVRQKLEKDGRTEPVIVLADPVSQNAGKLLAQYDNLVYHYLDKETRRKSKKTARELAKAWRRLDDAAKRALFSTGRKSAWPVIKGEFDLLFSFSSLYLITKYYYAFKRVIQENNVAAAYLNCLEGTYDLCLIGALRSLNKGIVYSPHGMAPQGFIARGHSVKKQLRDNIIFAMSGKEEAAQYERRGVKKEQLRITGPMIFDDIVRYADAAKTPHDKPTVCFFGQPMAQAKFMPQEAYMRYVERILREVGRIPNVQIIIKMHPREDYEDDYRKVVASLKLKDVEIEKRPGTSILYPIISKSDVTISFGSTADVEALILGKKVINIVGVKGGAKEPKEATPFEQAITIVDKDAPLAPVITRLFTDKKLQQDLEKRRQAYIEENFYKIDGKAHERVAQLIYEACKR